MGEDFPNKMVMIEYYKGWMIQLFLEDQYWQVNVIDPEGSYSGIGCLVGIHFHPFQALREAQERIDRHNAWRVLREILQEFCDRHIISEPEWENFSDSLTGWVVQ